MADAEKATFEPKISSSGLFNNDPDGQSLEKKLPLPSTLSTEPIANRGLWKRILAGQYEDAEQHETKRALQSRHLMMMGEYRRFRQSIWVACSCWTFIQRLVVPLELESF